jgi:DNA-binding transcriptional LysR family regulator
MVFSGFLQHAYSSGLGINEIMLDTPFPNIEFWLVYHADVQHNQRIRVLMSFLTAYLKELLS